MIEFWEDAPLTPRQLRELLLDLQGQITDLERRITSLCDVNELWDGS